MASRRAHLLTPCVAPAASPQSGLASSLLMVPVKAVTCSLTPAPFASSLLRGPALEECIFRGGCFPHPMHTNYNSSRACRAVSHLLADFGHFSNTCCCASPSLDNPKACLLQHCSLEGTQVHRSCSHLIGVAALAWHPSSHAPPAMASAHPAGTAATPIPALLQPQRMPENQHCIPCLAHLQP